MPKNIKLIYQPNKSLNYQTYLIGKFFVSFIGKVLIILSWLIGILGLVAIAYGFVSNSGGFINLGIKAVVIFLAWRILTIFFRDRLRRAEISPHEALLRLGKGEQVNSAELIAPYLFKALHEDDYQATQIADHIIDLKELRFILARANINSEIVHKKLQQSIAEVGARAQVLYKALQIAKVEGHDRIRPGDILVALCLVEPAMRDLIFNLGLETTDLLHIVYWYDQIREKPKKFLDVSRLNFTGGVGKDWIFGYTRILNRFAVDLTTQIKGSIYHLQHIAHDNEIRDMEKGLVQFASHNVVLVGEDGSGKRTAVYGLARKMVAGQTFKALTHRHLLEVDLESLLAGAQTPGDVAQRLNAVLKEAAQAGNTILYFDKITNLFTAKSVGQVNAAEVLIPYLNSSEVFIIGTATPKAYYRYIQSNLSVAEKFKAVEVNEPEQNELVRILEDTIPLIEKRAECFFTYKALKEVIKVTNKYIFDKPNPTKSISLLDKVAVEHRGQKIDYAQVQDVASHYYKIPVGEAEKEEKKKLLNLEAELHKRIINQNLAINEISDAMRRSRAGIGQKGKKPIGSFLFLGPTGVGKTETAKALAATYFGDEQAMFRFDMSEYQNKQDMYRLLGSPDEDGKPGELSKALKNRPFALFLFDEIEKANPDILNLFLQILDEGVATDSQGDKLIFKNAIIIATSNAGAEYIRQQIKAGVETQDISEGLVDYLLENNLFRPELINRFTSVVSFSTLNQSQIEEIAGMKIKGLIQRIKQDKEIQLTIEPPVIKEIARLGYNPEMGARPMERAIKRYLENLIAKKILAEEISRGGELNISVNDLER